MKMENLKSKFQLFHDPE